MNSRRRQRIRSKCVAAAISIKRLRPHCLLASMTARRSLARAESDGCATPRWCFQWNHGRPRPVRRPFRQPAPRSPSGSATASVSCASDSRCTSLRSSTVNSTCVLPMRSTRARKLASRSVEQRHHIAHAAAHDVRQMMGLVVDKYGPVGQKSAMKRKTVLTSHRLDEKRRGQNLYQSFPSILPIL